VQRNGPCPPRAKSGHRALACGLLISAVKEIAGVFSAGDEVDILSAIFSIAVTLPASLSAEPKPVLDYGFYKSRVEPIFLAKKDGHTRCVVCHSDSNNTFHLEKLGLRANAWTEEQSRRNFEMVAKLVNPGDPESSLLTQHPLAPEAGGHAFHSGGRQFESKNDEDWKTLVAFVNGAKAP
jgi:hypothetical protein